MFINGCFGFSPSDKSIVFKNETAYLIPNGVMSWKIDNSLEQSLKASGATNCLVGDILWIENDFWNDNINGLINPDNNYIANVAQKAASQALSGCVKAMSKQELSYYMYQQQIKELQKQNDLRQNTLNSLKEISKQLQTSNEQMQNISNKINTPININNNIQVQELNNNLKSINNAINEIAKDILKNNN